MTNEIQTRTNILSSNIAENTTDIGIWVRNWKELYNEISDEIRNERTLQKEKHAALNTANYYPLWDLRKSANQMLMLRHMQKGRARFVQCHGGW